MKRDMELLRAILLKYEAESTNNLFKPNQTQGIEGYSPEAFIAHCTLLKDAGFIKHHEDTLGRKEKSCEITWAGYEFLDSVRDDEVWRKTKKIADDVQGFTIDILQDVAKGFLKTQIKKLSGVEI
jgi:hypothetical protein